SRSATSDLYKPSSRSVRMCTIVPTLINLAHSLTLTAFSLTASYEGSELFSYFLAIFGDFSWPFMSILWWPLTAFMQLAGSLVLSYPLFQGTFGWVTKLPGDR